MPFTKGIEFDYAVKVKGKLKLKSFFLSQNEKYNKNKLYINKIFTS